MASTTSLPAARRLAGVDAAKRPALPVPGIDRWTLALDAIAATAPR